MARTIKKVSSELLEINKPSSLCQVMYFENVKKGIFAFLTPLQIDMINFILYESRKHISINNIDLSTATSFELVLSLKSFSEMFGKYTTSYVKLIDYLRDIRKTEIVINVLGKDKTTEISYTSILHEVRVINDKDTHNKAVKLLINAELAGLMLNVDRLFSKMYLTIQFSMESKYAKLLYEILKDYEKINSKEIEIDILLGLLNVRNIARYSKYTYFNSEILKKAVAEINEKSDIQVTYSTIKDYSPTSNRKVVSKIKFSINSQSEERKKELGIIKDDSMEENILQPYAKKKFDALPQFKKKSIKSPEAYISAIIMNEKDELLAMHKLDQFISKEIVDAEFDRSQPNTLVFVNNIDQEILVINNDYYLVNIETKIPVTTSAKKTQDYLNNLFEQDILETTMLELGIKDEWSNSTVNS